MNHALTEDVFFCHLIQWGDRGYELDKWKKH